MINSLLKIVIIFLPLVTTSCDRSSVEEVKKLKPIKTYSLKISEPSDLSLNKEKLWTVSDRNSIVYKTNLKGEIEFSFKIKGTDLEGITIFDDSLIAVALEISRTIVITDLNGNEISRTTLEINGSKNSGLEGITYNSSTGHFYLVNEKDPALLIETDKNLKEIRRKQIKKVRDLSGVSYSQKEDCLWLLSDEDRKIIKSSLDGDFIEEFKINVQQPEGIAVDDKNDLIYIVSDKEAKLYIYKLE